jgi:transposase
MGEITSKTGSELLTVRVRGDPVSHPRLIVRARADSDNARRRGREAALLLAGDGRYRGARAAVALKSNDSPVLDSPHHPLMTIEIDQQRTKQQPE